LKDGTALVCLGWAPTYPPVADINANNDLQNFTYYPRKGEKGNRFSPPNPPTGPFIWMEEDAMLRAAGLDPSTASLADSYDPIFPTTFNPKVKPEVYLTKWTHAGYAATWYSLGIAGLILMNRMFR
jgi:cytochrome oxidase assembly protein ShyY1